MGTQTLVAQVPGESSASSGTAAAYSLESDSTSAVTEVRRGTGVQATVPAPYNDSSKYYVLSTKTLNYFKGASTLAVETYAAPAETTYVIVAKEAVAQATAANVGLGTITLAGGATAIVIFVFSLGSDSAKAATDGIANFTIAVNGLGNVSTTKETWTRTEQVSLSPGDTSITKSMIARGIKAMGDAKEEPKRELWEDDPTNPIDYLELFKQNGILYHIYLQTVGVNALGGREFHCLQCWPAGLKDWTTSSHWPSLMTLSQLAWSDTASKIMPVLSRL